MKMFAIKDERKELYFQIEKSKKSLDLIDNLACELFEEEGYRFENRWQSGIPDKEDYFGYENKGIYFGVVISEKRIHLIIKGIKEIKKKEIKKTVTKDCKLNTN